MLIIPGGDYILIIDQHIEGVLSRGFYVFNVFSNYLFFHTARTVSDLKLDRTQTK